MADERRERRRQKILNSSKNRLDQISSTLYKQLSTEDAKDEPMNEDEDAAPVARKSDLPVEIKKPSLVEESPSSPSSIPRPSLEFLPPSDDASNENSAAVGDAAVINRSEEVAPRRALILPVIAGLIAFVWVFLSLVVDIAIPEEVLNERNFEEQYGDFGEIVKGFYGLTLAFQQVITDRRVAGVCAEVLLSFLRGNPSDEVGVFTPVPVLIPFITAETMLMSSRKTTTMEMLKHLFQDFSIYFFTMAVLLHSVPALIASMSGLE